MDNGSNMIKAVRVAAPDQIGEDEQCTTDIDTDDDDDADENSLQSKEDDDSEVDEHEIIGTVDESEGIPLPGDSISLHRFPCIAHTLQLVLKEVEHNVAYTKVVSKARGIGKKIIVSSVATEKMVTLCGPHSGRFLTVNAEVTHFGVRS